MEYRLLGKTGLKISVIGFGTWGFGGWWGRRDDRSAVSSIEKAIEQGVNFFDTALVYGDGHSEQLLGKSLRKYRDKVVIATKIPPKNFRWPADPKTPIQSAFPKKWMLECTQKSLKNLGLDFIALQQLHVWTDSWFDPRDWQEGAEELKKQGLIQAFGVSVNDHAPETALKLVASGKIDTVQVIYNLFDQSPQKELFPLCQKRNIGVIARVPFDEGSLTGTFTLKTKFSTGDWRQKYFKGERFKETVGRVERLKELLEQYGELLPEAALRFCIADPAVTTVIPGMRKPEHVSSNTRVPERKLPEELIEKLKSHAWKRNFYIGTPCYS